MKTFRKTVAVIYASTSLFLNAVIIMSIIYAFSTVNIDNASIGIIGGADTPTFLYIFTKLLNGGIVSFLLFPISVIGFNIVNLISAFSKNRISNILLLIWAVVNLVLFLCIPPSSMVIVTYILYTPIIDTFWCYFFMKILSPKIVFFVSSIALTVIFGLNIKGCKNKDKIVDLDSSLHSE